MRWLRPSRPASGLGLPLYYLPLIFIYPLLPYRSPVGRTGAYLGYIMPNASLYNVPAVIAKGCPQLGLYCAGCFAHHGPRKFQFFIRKHLIIVQALLVWVELAYNASGKSCFPR